MGRIADTSFLYAAFDSADTRHKQAQDELAKPQALEIPLVVLAEFLDLIEYRHDRETARRAYLDLTRLATVQIHRIEAEATVAELWAAHKDISMVDAAGIRAASATKSVLLSYDNAQLKVLAAIVRSKN